MVLIIAINLFYDLIFNIYQRFTLKKLMIVDLYYFDIIES